LDQFLRIINVVRKSIFNDPREGRITVMKKINLIVILALFLFLAGGLAEGFEGYEWMPEGGCQILTSLNRSDLLTLATTNKTEEEWEKFFADTELTEEQVKTLAAYLALQMPVPKNKLPPNVKELTCDVLPYDGQMVVLKVCQNCHGLGQVVLQEKDLTAWYIQIGARSHNEIELDEKDSQLIVTYLSINMPVSEETIPKALLESFMSY
jgi:mono/diheme cytochrome c family protein